ncbi:MULTISPECIES: hypothetical protein [unclassified Streptomyces]|jgi:hypothetical protein|nr:MULTISPECIES: hypothetical protein [unclassified Streptomyces]
MNPLPLPRAPGRVTVHRAAASTGHSPNGAASGGGADSPENGTVA